MKCHRKTEAKRCSFGTGQRLAGTEVVSGSVSAAVSGERQYAGLVRLRVRDLLSLQDPATLRLKWFDMQSGRRCK